MYLDKCPNHNDATAIERAKVREAEFKAWKAKNQPTRAPQRERKKTSFKDRVNKKVQAAVAKTLEEKKDNTAGTPA